jgi:DeoR family transcriptional regulator, fructose operon transcriptional repressor
VRGGANAVGPEPFAKLGSRARARTFTLHEVDLLVTDLDPKDARLNPYRDRVELR